jgi:hypothetical protein
MELWESIDDLSNLYFKYSLEEHRYVSSRKHYVSCELFIIYNKCSEGYMGFESKFNTTKAQIHQYVYCEFPLLSVII